MKPVAPTTAPVLAVQETAEYLHVNVHFVRRLIRKKVIHYIKLGNLVRFDTTVLAAYVEAGRRKAILR